MANALGFFQMQFKWVQNGKPCSFSNTFGLQAGVDTGDPLVNESIIYGFKTAWNNQQSEAYNLTKLSQFLPAPPYTSDFSVRVIGRGGLGQPMMQLQLIAPTQGSRQPPEDVQLLPVQQTLSGYAPRQLFLGDGARMSVSGGFEYDWLGDSVGWANGAGYFKTLVESFMSGINDFLESVEVAGGYLPRLCVVEHIKYVTSSGKDAYRLPTEPNDAAVTHNVDAFEFSDFAGSQNKRKRKLRRR